MQEVLLGVRSAATKAHSDAYLSVQERTQETKLPSLGPPSLIEVLTPRARCAVRVKLVQNTSSFSARQSEEHGPHWNLSPNNGG